MGLRHWLWLLTEISDISKYPESPRRKAAAESMIEEMRPFQRKRFERFVQQEAGSLNEQEREELSFYWDQF